MLWIMLAHTASLMLNLVSNSVNCLHVGKKSKKGLL